MTMDITKDHVEYIAGTLETKVVTYHTAARDLGIHVSESKAILSSYYRANKSRVTASFVATGTRQGSLVVRVFDSEADLTEKCNSVFDAVNTVHVYCLSSSKNSFTSVDIALEERKHSTDLSKLANYHSLGLLEGPELERSCSSKAKGGSIVTSGSPSVEPKQKSAVSEEQKPDPAPKTEKAPEKPKLVYQSRKQQPKTSSISNYVSRKSEKTKPTGTNPGTSTSSVQKRPAQDKPSYEYKSRKVERSQPKERVVVSNIDAENDVADEVMEDVPPPKPSVTETELNDLFLDDFTDEDEKDTGNQEMEIDQPIVVDQAEQDPSVGSPTGEHAEEEKQEQQQLPKDDIWTSMSSKSPAPEPVVQNEDIPAPETTVDEDGYFTSYKKSEPKPEPEKKKTLRKPPPKPTKPIKKSDGKLKQTSLMSFFGKK
ncbi:hypothetical protein JCM33374_g611 [Metschnikowia sp. JCM 33374]|nr:hypothetical protein JCM33374_g611 [Metschnikowia sp. JCM 33374]